MAEPVSWEARTQTCRQAQRRAGYGFTELVAGAFPVVEVQLCSATPLAVHCMHTTRECTGRVQVL